MQTSLAGTGSAFRVIAHSIPLVSGEECGAGACHRGSLPVGSSCAIATEYCAAASANCPPRNSSLPRLLKTPGLSAALGSSGWWLSPVLVLAVAFSRWPPCCSTRGPGVRPRRDRLPPSLRIISFFWMLPMAAVGKGAGGECIPVPRSSLAGAGGATQRAEFQLPPPRHPEWACCSACPKIPKDRVQRPPALN